MKDNAKLLKFFLHFQSRRRMVGTLEYESEDGNFNFAMVAGEIRGNRWFRQCPRNGGESREN